MKKLFLIIIGCIVVLIIAALIAPYFISADTFKKPLLAKIEAATGRHVTVDGKFQLRFFPVAGITMEGVTLTNPPSFGDTRPLVSLKSLEVDVAVMPLIDRHIEIQKLVLDQPQINLHVGKDGVKNWLPPQQTAEAVPAPANPASAYVPAPAKSPAMLLPQGLTLGDVKLVDGSVAYDDESKKQQWNLQKINAALSLSGVNDPFTVDAGSEWNGKQITVKGTLATVQSFLSGQSTKVDIAINSELISVNAGGVIENSVYSGNAKVKSSSLKALSAWLNPAAPVRMQGPLALDLSSDVKCSMHDCAMTNTSLTLDKIEAKGDIKANWQDKPQIDVVLTTGVLDFNPFMSQQAGASGILFPDAYAETEGHWSDKPMDFSALNSINGTADITTDGIVVNKITIGKTTLKAKLDNGQLNANVIDAVMYGGKGNVAVNINAAGAVPTVEKHAVLKGVQVQPLLRDALNLTRLSGAADIDISVNSRGRSEKEMVDNLAGKGQFTLNNGALKGVDIASIALKKSGGTQDTPINDMKGSFLIAQGVVSNKDLVMDLPTMHISGQGDVNLPAYSINYHLTPQVTQAADKSGKSKVGVAVPVIIEGSLEKPNIHPDLNALAQSALQNPQQFKQQLKNTRDSLKNGLSNPDAVKNIKNLLQGF